MRILALEHSTRLGSIAVIEDGVVRATAAWTDDRHHSQQGFPLLAALIRRREVDLARLDLLVAGTGPGAFTGLRMSVAALQGMALPGGTPVCGVSSGMALAWEAMTETGVQSVWVVGDARRGRYWAGRFLRRDDGLRADGEWQLLTEEEWVAYIAPETLLVTPDWERMEGLRQKPLPPGAHWLPGGRAPTAVAVGRLAWAQWRRAEPLAPPVPVYLHPAVFVAPSFPS